jgi:hypothetical protein
MGLKKRQVSGVLSVIVVKFCAGLLDSDEGGTPAITTRAILMFYFGYLSFTLLQFQVGYVKIQIKAQKITTR